MIEVLSGDGSRTRDGTSRARRHPLWMLHPLAVALATLFIVSTGLASVVRCGPRPLTLTFVAASSEAVDVTHRDVSASDPHWYEAISHPEIELRAVESDADDEGAPCDVPEERPSYECALSPRSPVCPAHGEVLRRPSCFEAGTGLPRGPPV